MCVFVREKYVYILKYWRENEEKPIKGLCLERDNIRKRDKDRR